MTKTRVIKLIAILLAAVVTVVALAPLEIASSDEGMVWMSKLDDNTKISEMSIPGTHNSGSSHSIADLTGKCQSLDIMSQLNIGVRLIDLRLGCVGESGLRVVHSFMDQANNFNNVLKTLTDFIKENPDEFILLCIKEDTDPIGEGQPFAKRVEDALAKYPEQVSLDTELPATLGEARGRIHILSRFDADFGVPLYSGWQDSASFEIGDYYVQDNYCVDSTEEKIADIDRAIEKSDSGEYSLVLNFASCYLDPIPMPPNYAGFPAMKINPYLLENLEGGEGALGVLLVDFVTVELSRAIYRRNFK